jgi:hypothetical protein
MTEREEDPEEGARRPREEEPPEGASEPSREEASPPTKEEPAEGTSEPTPRTEQEARPRTKQKAGGRAEQKARPRAEQKARPRTEQKARPRTKPKARPRTEEQGAPTGDELEPSQRLDLLAELDAILELGRRAPGSDAERRTALHLQRRLAALGRSAETESLAIHPGWPLAYALLAAAAVGASVLSVYVPAAGAAVALGAALLTFFDAGVLIPVVRPLFGRRASQNVVSWGGSEKAGAVVLVAHYDAGRAGFAYTDRTARRRAAISGLIRRPIGGLQPLFWAELGVLACALLRLTGLDATALTVVQFIPTFVLIVAVALLTDIALSGTRAGENDNASGTVLALGLTERLGGAHALEHFDVHVLFTGAQKAGAAGMRAFLKRHRDRLAPDRTVFLNVDQVGSGAVRYTRREGALFTQRSHPQLVALGDQIAEDDESDGPRSIVSRSASDAYAAGALGFPAISVTCRDRLDYASGRVEEQAVERAQSFCVELLQRLDAEIGPSLAAPGDETALSEPEAT